MFVAKIKNSAKNPLIRWLAAFLALLCSVTAGLGLWYWHYCQSPAQLTAETTVFIPRGAGVRQIGTLLAAQGVLRNDIRYLTYLRLSGLGEKLKAGEYAFAPGITPPQVLAKIARGEVVRHPVTIAEGLRLTQIAAIFAQDGWVDPALFLALAQDTAFIRSLGLNMDEGMEINSLEGYLFPDTYLMVRDEAPASTVPTEPTGKPQELQKSQGTREEKLIRHMVQRFEEVWASLPKTEQAGLSEAGIGGLLGLNALIVVACEMLILHRVERLSPLAVIGPGAFLLCLGFALLPLGRGALFAAGTVVVWTVGEMLTLPLANIFVAARAGPGRAGRYIGAYTMAFSTAFLVAPALGLSVYGRFGGGVLWGAAGAVGGGLWLGFRALERVLASPPADASRAGRAD